MQGHGLGHVWRDTLISVGVVSAIPLVCLIALARERWVRSVSTQLTSLAVGALLANAVFELIPEAIGRWGGWLPVAGYVLLGFALFAVMERWLGFHLEHSPVAGHVRPYVVLNMVGVTLHNAIDGMIIAAGFAAGSALGVATTIAVVLHEIPHEIGNFGVFVHGGVSPARAVLLNFGTALAAILGAVITLWIGLGTSALVSVLLPFAAGNFIYVATVDLIPELRRELTGRQLGFSLLIMVAGAVLVVLPLLLHS